MCPRCKIHFKCSEQCRKPTEPVDEELECFCLRCLKPHELGNPRFMSKCKIELNEKVMFT